jgi:hypothetical protein
MAGQISLGTPHATIVVAPFLQAQSAAGTPGRAYYQRRHHAAGIGASQIRTLGLAPNQYALFLGRLIPEKPDWGNSCIHNIENGSIRLVVTGSSETDQYVETLKRLARRQETHGWLPTPLRAEPAIETGQVRDSPPDSKRF